jgi:hypothetical protein
MDKTRLGAWTRTILRRIHGPVVEQGIWRKRSNQEFREQYKNLDIVADIKEKRVEWIGHVVRTDQRRTVKKICESKPQGSIRTGRSRLRWLEDVQKDFMFMVPCIVTNLFLIKPTDALIFPNLFLSRNSTCFGQFLCPKYVEFLTKINLEKLVRLLVLLKINLQEDLREMKFKTWRQ